MALRNMAPFGAVQYIRKIIGYEEYLKQCAASRHMPEEELFQILEELTDSAPGRVSDTVRQWFDHMEEYREKTEEPSPGGAR